MTEITCDGGTVDRAKRRMLCLLQMLYEKGSLHVHDGKDDVCYGYGGGMEDIAACMGEAVLKEYGYESEGEFTSKSVTGVAPEVLRMEDKSPSCSSGSGSKRQERKTRPESRPDQLVRGWSRERSGSGVSTIAYVYEAWFGSAQIGVSEVARSSFVELGSCLMSQIRGQSDRVRLFDCWLVEPTCRRPHVARPIHEAGLHRHVGISCADSSK